MVGIKDVLAFDYDGVLADSLETNMKALNAVFRKHGMKEFRNKEEFLSMFDSNFWEQVKQRGISKQMLQRMIADFEKELALLQNNILIFDGIAEMLAALSERYMIFIITSNATLVVKAFLAAHSITCVTDVYGADANPDKTQKLLSIKKSHPGKEIYYIGDTAGDVREARNAGVKSVAVSWGYHSSSKLEKEKPDYVADSPASLVSLFNTF